ncbi:hypothetical protein CKN63_03430 [Carnobacterium divergens]|uniref:helix-turn-helix domain-containing protein n=1 Tax=Carnobacterium divergens TaxID=2748 RepID=UPI00107210CE|nr:XRE family transcriptional regulator [Carnobacterium divergens]TFI67543.1 hypothetical protein CKN59_03390 [Carnobacterium divergens]TFI67664.1 hypothetical protein CKN76_03465 [Carnobacterium divergens]TFI82577.1 hypothetical protein CKN74_03430 [Carnobacterium divergens]TFI92656.1 hypothetical protein CKN61_03440 [Carnobacterium divergens]TFJ08644.1 hypothetical protein CKN75_03460 [Carnobacterium divergens]
MTSNVVEFGNTFSGQALKKARLFNGQTISELSDSIGVTHQAISNYEKEKNTPSYDVLIKISESLKFPVQYFYKTRELGNESVGFYRKGSNVTKKNRVKVAELASFSREIFEEIEKVVFVPSYSDPIELKRRKKYSPLDFQYIEDVADLIREKFKFGSGPIINLTGFLESLGIYVVFAYMDDTKIDAYTTVVEGRPIILLNAEKKSSSRVRFNLAHELAHILFHRDYEKIYQNGENFSTIEDEANHFAGCFLLPEAGLVEDLTATSLQHLIVLKSHWNVSIAAIITRANQCGFFSDKHTLHLRQQMSRGNMRIVEPLDNELEIEKPTLVKQAIEIYEKKHNGNAVAVLANNLRLFPSFVEDIILCEPKAVQIKSNLRIV